MPGSLARKERRRKEREGMRSPAAAKTAYVESVDDEGEPRGGAVQKTEDKPADSNEGELPVPQTTLSPQERIANLTSDIPSLVPASEPPKGSQPRPQGPARPPPTSPATKNQDRDQIDQKQSKNRSKRGRPPRIPPESEPPFESLRNAPSSVYEEAIATLRNMSTEESARLRNVVISQMAAEGFPIVTEGLRSKRIQDPSYPVRSIINPPWAPSARKKDVMTEEEAENLRRAMFAKMSQSTDQDWVASMAQSLEKLKIEKSLALQASIGNVDGPSQSVEIVTPEQEAPSGEQAPIVQPKKREDTETVKSLLVTNIESKLKSLPHAGKYCTQ
ncbi:uncharacterized protein CC84DRAFT_886284 [Paraphaeosphaeria sporulosa]|uniref:Uncharacterized protein n=1 Tax=Paraphaeosphaeria sporulosa TaxID=1460663 RepID=A0A177CBJ5_9PLEO|nr:uncharacterized protein CC84DRAFT_886284 [Paraphaeosphaeria sporulosa]OAG04070.1 hypothetical protein CC84DRAFT_886284 [Paraphaeosphaeria sporulosa]